jgi:hypothetical protein
MEVDGEPAQIMAAHFEESMKFARKQDEYAAFAQTLQQSRIERVRQRVPLKTGSASLCFGEVEGLICNFSFSRVCVC